MLPSTSPSAPISSAAASFLPICSAKSCTLFAFPVTWTSHSLPVRSKSRSSPRRWEPPGSPPASSSPAPSFCRSRRWRRPSGRRRPPARQIIIPQMKSTSWCQLCERENGSYIVKVVLKLLGGLKVGSESKVVDPWALTKVHSLQDQGWILGDAVRIQMKSKRGKWNVLLWLEGCKCRNMS